MLEGMEAREVRYDEKGILFLLTPAVFWYTG